MKHVFGEGQPKYAEYGFQSDAVTNVTYAEFFDDGDIYRHGVQLGGAWTAMPTQTDINLANTGRHNPHEHNFLMNVFLKGPETHNMGDTPGTTGAEAMGNALGFKGFVITDYNMMAGQSSSPGGPTKANSDTRMGAGCDMAMNSEGAGGTNRYNWIVNFSGSGTDHLGNTITSDQRRDDAVLRVLRVKAAMGMIDVNAIPPNPTADEIKAAMRRPPAGNGVQGAAEDRAVVRDIASRTFVLMKNENRAIQQLRDATNILITGQGANNKGLMCGGWTDQWAGDTTNTSQTTGYSVWGAIQNRWTGSVSTTLTSVTGAGKTVTIANSTGNNGTTPYGGGATNAITGTYDAVIAFIGETPHAENNDWAGSENYPQITLRTGTGNATRGGNFNDNGMLQAVYDYKKANPAVPLIVVLWAGRPMSVTDPANLTVANAALHVNNWDAFIWGGLPGTEGGDAFVDVIFDKDKAFFGKSPYTWRTSYHKSQWQNINYENG
jgi:beta-glucosidase